MTGMSEDEGTKMVGWNRRCRFLFEINNYIILTKSLPGAINSTQECFTQGAQITVQVDQSYYLFAQLSPASPCTCLASTDSMWLYLSLCFILDTIWADEPIGKKGNKIMRQDDLDYFLPRLSLGSLRLALYLGHSIWVTGRPTNVLDCL